MSTRNNYSKSDYAKYILSDIESNSSDKVRAKEFLIAEGLDADDIVAKVIRRIKRIQMNLAAEKTEAEMTFSRTFREKAMEMVEKKINEVSFSFLEFVQEKQLSISYRSVESLSSENIKDVMLAYYESELSKESSRKNNES